MGRPGLPWWAGAWGRSPARAWPTPSMRRSEPPGLRRPAVLCWGRVGSGRSHARCRPREGLVRDVPPWLRHWDDLLWQTGGLERSRGRTRPRRGVPVGWALRQTSGPQSRTRSHPGLGPMPPPVAATGKAQQGRQQFRTLEHWRRYRAAAHWSREPPADRPQETLGWSEVRTGTGAPKTARRQAKTG